MALSSLRVRRGSRATRLTLRVVTAGVFGLAGLLLATTAVTARGTDLRAARAADLGDLVHARSLDLDRLQGQVDAMASRVDQLGDGDRSAGLARRRAALAPGAGLTELTGPGVRVVLDDAPRNPGQSLPGNPTPDDLVVHQQDVQAVVNAMWRAGASGVSVMGQRLATTSAVRCVGNTLLLGGRVYSPPFRIEAVGDADRIVRALDDDPQVQIYREYVALYGLGYAVHDEPELTLAAYSGPLPSVDVPERPAPAAVPPSPRAAPKPACCLASTGICRRRSSRWRNVRCCCPRSLPHCPCCALLRNWPAARQNPST